MRNKLWTSLATLVLALAFFSAAARADDASENGPGAARISNLQGEVSLQRGDSGDWVGATLNAPVMQGDTVATGARSRVELELDYANVLRLASQSQAKIANLSRNQIQVQVGQGLAEYVVYKGNEASAEIDTPNVAVRPLSEGSYRIQVDSDSQTELIVRKGEAEVSTPQGSTRVQRGQLITIRGRDNPEYQIGEAPGHDDWDRWNSERDRRIREAQSWAHTNRYYTGSEDLDRYGHWTYVPGYDSVWVPDEPPGWTPYSCGRWVWEPYYGWTWQPCEPWGWAPYHYGRWFWWGDAWVWWPGPVTPVYYPVWAPAYVTFFGFGFGHFSFGFGFGSIGWLPVGPCDPFFPWWGGFGFGRGFGFNSVNITNITNITNIANIQNITGGRVPVVPPLAGAGRPVISNVQALGSNIHVRQALATMPASQFGKAPVARNRTPISPSQIRQAQLVAGRVPAVPTRQSLFPSGRPASRASLPARSIANERFVSKVKPPSGPEPFNRQVAEVRQILQSQRPRQSITAKAISHSVPGSGAAPDRGNLALAPHTGAVPAKQAPTANSAGGNPNAGWRSFAAPGRAHTGTSAAPDRGAAPAHNLPLNTARSGVQGEGERAGGWHQFSGSGGTAEHTIAPERGSTPGLGQAPIRANTLPAERQNGWRSFSGRAAGEPGIRAASPNRPATPSVRLTPNVESRPGWSRFSPPPAGSGGPPRWEEPASRAWQPPVYRSSPSYQRPPLNLSKPIERAPRSGEWFGGGRASYGSRGYRGGGGGGHSAPSHSGGSSSRGHH